MDCIIFIRKWVNRIHKLFKYDDIPNGRLEGVLFEIRVAKKYLERQDYERLGQKLDKAESFLRAYVREAGIELDYFNEK